MKNKQFLFVITYGRSGSTLLMGFLNSIPGYKIIGENNDAYNYLMSFYEAMLTAKAANDNCERNFDCYKTQNPWWNDFDEEQLKQDIRQLANNLISPEGEAKVIGFKEIRYISHTNDLESYLNWLYYITNCRFIFLTRNKDDVVKSEWWGDGDPETQIERIDIFEQRIFNYIADHNFQSWHHITYEQMCNGAVKGLFDWLGETISEEKIREILATPYGYKTIGEIKTIKF